MFERVRVAQKTMRNMRQHSACCMLAEANVLRPGTERQSQGDVPDGVTPRDTGHVDPWIAVRAADGPSGRTEERRE